MSNQKAQYFRVVEFMATTDDQGEVNGNRVIIRGDYETFTEAEKFINTAEKKIEDSAFRIDRIWV